MSESGYRRQWDARRRLEKQLADSQRVQRQLAEALRQIEFLPYSVMGDVEADLRRTKEIAQAALAASDALDEEKEGE